MCPQKERGKYISPAPYYFKVGATVCISDQVQTTFTQILPKISFKVLRSKFSELRMSRFPIIRMVNHNMDGNITNPPPRRKAGHRGTCAQTQKTPQGAAGGVQAPKQGCRNSGIGKANSDAHHLCLKYLGSGQRRQQKLSHCSPVPAEQVWDLFLQPRFQGESHWMIQRAPRSLRIPWVLPAANKSIRRWGNPSRHKPPSASAKGTSPSDFSWGFINPFKGFNKTEKTAGNSFCCKTAKEEKGRGQILPLSWR